MLGWKDRREKRRERFRRVIQGENMPRDGRFAPGCVCRHHSGRVYTIIAIANEAHPSEKFPISVVYQGANGEIWTRPLAQFVEKFTVLFDGSQIA